MDSKFSQALCTTNVSQNFVMSPFTLNTALNLLYCGSVGATEQAIATVNSITDNNPVRIANEYHGLLNQLRNSTNVQLAINLFLANAYTAIQPNFASTATRQFYTPITNVDFGNSIAAASEINGLVANETNQLVRKMVDPSVIAANMEMILTNTITFNQAWWYQFPVVNTTTSQFYVNGDCDATNGTSVPIQMMHLRVRFKRLRFMRDFYQLHNGQESLYQKHIEGLNADVLRLNLDPYAEIFMYVVLPSDCSGLAQLESTLTTFDIKTAFQQFKFPRNILVSLPKFTISNQLDLNPILTKVL